MDRDRAIGHRRGRRDRRLPRGAPTTIRRLPAPPTPSIAADGTATFTIEPGTEVDLPATTIEVGDVIICAGKGRRAVPRSGHEINGHIYVYTDPTGAVVASCAPHPLVEM